ncbi:MAG: NTP transferase domain-containing protein [Bacteroidota bacterium]|jgi:CTP:molybdopterin cytidylyltransferase MocA
MLDAVLLISGSSYRMGREKALLPFSEDNVFITHIIQNYLQIRTEKIILIVNKSNIDRIKNACKSYSERLEFVLNLYPEQGRLWSIKTGLSSIEKGHGVFLQNIDNPFINSKLLNGLSALYNERTYVVPRFKEKNGHPLLLGEQIVKDFNSEIESITDFKQFLNGYEKRNFLTDNKAILANINTLEDYYKWFPDFADSFLAF